MMQAEKTAGRFTNRPYKEIAMLLLALLVGQASQACAQSSIGADQGIKNPVATNVSSAAVSAAGGLLSSNNLTDVANTSSALSNLGIGTAGTANLPVIGSPGGFSPLEQTVTDTLPTSSANVTCLSNAGGAYPIWHWYSGSLSGANVTYTLPGTAGNCIANSGIGFTIRQDASHTVTFAPGTGTVIPAQICPQIPAGADSILEVYFIYNPATATPSWVEHCGGTIPQTASGPANGMLWRVTLLNHTNAPSGTPYAVLATDSVLQADSSGGTLGITLPACAAGNVGKQYVLKKTSSDANSITTTPTGADTIDGAASTSLSAAGGAQWFICSATAGLWLRGHITALGGDLSATSNSATVAKINGDALSTPPNIPNWQVFYNGVTSITPPTGCTDYELFACGGGGGGGAQQTGSTTACTAASGAGGACGRFHMGNPNGQVLTVVIGLGGTAGVDDPTTPTVAGDGTNTTITFPGPPSKTITITGGTHGGTNSNGAGCVTVTAPGSTAAPSGNLGAFNSAGIPVSLPQAVTGSAGLNGSASTTRALGGSSGNAGGSAGNINASGVEQNAPTAGAPGYIIGICNKGVTVY
jgi:hypothetical protein